MAPGQLDSSLPASCRGSRLATRACDYQHLVHSDLFSPQEDEPPLTATELHHHPLCLQLHEKTVNDGVVTCFHFIDYDIDNGATSASTSTSSADEDPSSSLCASLSVDAQTRSSHFGAHSAALSPSPWPWTTDSNGDLRLPRRPRPTRKHHRSFYIRHTADATPLVDVGQQVWRGACLLADWLLNGDQTRPQNSFKRMAIRESLVLELGGGVGLAAVAAASVCRYVVVSDVHKGALRLTAENLARNAALVDELRRRGRRRGRRLRLVKEGESDAGGNGAEVDGNVCSDVSDSDSDGGVQVHVCQLDWFDFLAYGSASISVEAIVRALHDDADSSGSGGGCVGDGNPVVAACVQTPPPGDGGGRVKVSYGGGAVAVLDAVAAADSLCLVAADTVYDPVLTEAFVKCAATLMSYHKFVRQARHRELTKAHQRSRTCTDKCGDPQAAIHESHHDDGVFSNAECGSGDVNGGRRPGLNSDGGGECGSGGSAHLIVSFEKRTNFVLTSMAAVAPAFNDFMSYVLPEQPTVDAPAAAAPEAVVTREHGLLEPPPNLPPPLRPNLPPLAVMETEMEVGLVTSGWTRHLGADSSSGNGRVGPAQGFCRGGVSDGYPAGDWVSGGHAVPSACGRNQRRQEEARASPGKVEEEAGSAEAVDASSEWPHPRQPLFRGRRLDVSSVPQVLQYERSQQLELWELTLL